MYPEPLVVSEVIERAKPALLKIRGMLADDRHHSKNEEGEDVKKGEAESEGCVGYAIDGTG